MTGKGLSRMLAGRESRLNVNTLIRILRSVYWAGFWNSQLYFNVRKFNTLIRVSFLLCNIAVCVLRRCSHRGAALPAQAFYFD